MKPSERLKEIESWLSLEGNLRGQDCYWIIARVKRLTEALEFYAKDPIYAGDVDWQDPAGFELIDTTYVQNSETARKALYE